ncbi:MAG: hypothetical protein AAF481_00810 [Acidobacteriota bacterium]
MRRWTCSALLILALIATPALAKTPQHEENLSVQMWLNDLWSKASSWLLPQADVAALESSPPNATEGDGEPGGGMDPIG